MENTEKQVASGVELEALLKKIARVLFTISAVLMGLCLFAGFILLIVGLDSYAIYSYIGLGVAVFGAIQFFLSWLGMLFMVGFAEIVGNTARIAKNTAGNYEKIEKEEIPEL